MEKNFSSACIKILQIPRWNGRNTHPHIHTVLLFNMQRIADLRLFKFRNINLLSCSVLATDAIMPNGCWDTLSPSSSIAISSLAIPILWLGTLRFSLTFLCCFLARVFSSIPEDMPSSRGHHQAPPNLLGC